jgi:hypothetical protein
VARINEKISYIRFWYAPFSLPGDLKTLILFSTRKQTDQQIKIKIDGRKKLCKGFISEHGLCALFRTNDKTKMLT